MVDPNKVLIAFDGSENALRAARYAANMFGLNKTLNFTLCGIYAKIPHGHDLDADVPMPGMQEVRHSLKDLEVAHEEGRARIEEATQVFIEAGVEPSRIHSKYLEKKETVPKDLMREIHEGGYGTVILGRRGQSNFSDFIFGRVSSTLVTHLQGHTVIVVE